MTWIRLRVPGTRYLADSDGVIWSSPELRATVRRDGDGYQTVGRFHVHTLVARAFIGDRPAGRVVDHRDQDVDNNRPSNLRYATRSVNAHNSKPLWHHNTNGTKGVIYDRGRWKAYITHNNKRTYHGRHATKAAAIRARRAAERSLSVLG
jgi:hypothetical protein